MTTVPCVFVDSGNLLLPRELTLDKCSISHAGDDDEIQLHVDVHALDLTGNSLREWHEVPTRHHRYLTLYTLYTFHH